MALVLSPASNTEICKSHVFAADDFDKMLYLWFLDKFSPNTLFFPLKLLKTLPYCKIRTHLEILLPHLQSGIHELIKPLTSFDQHLFSPIEDKRMCMSWCEENMWTDLSALVTVLINISLLSVKIRDFVWADVRRIGNSNQGNRPLWMYTQKMFKTFLYL